MGGCLLSAISYVTASMHLLEDCAPLLCADTCFQNYERMFVPMGERPKAAPNSMLHTHTLFKHVQARGSP